MRRGAGKENELPCENSTTTTEWYWLATLVALVALSLLFLWFRPRSSNTANNLKCTSSLFFVVSGEKCREERIVYL